MAELNNDSLSVSITTAISEVIAEIDSITAIKPEQESALVEFIDGKDVLAVLPTGFGKSLIYQLAPLVTKKLFPSIDPIFIVISPLVELINDQIKEATKLGITAMRIGVDVHSDTEIQQGRCQLVFGSPETWLLNEKWRNMLANPVYRQNLKGIVVDEVHVTYRWGHGAKGKRPFRESFAKLGELRSIVKHGTPVLALTASADMRSRDRVTQILHMGDAKQVIVSPNRSNIRLGLATTPRRQLQCLDWIVDDVRAKAASMAPIIIYCRSFKAVGEVFSYLKAKLGEDLWLDKDPEHKIDNKLVGMFHSKTKEENRDNVIRSLNGQGNCRVVVATTSLGMGLNFPNVSHVVMFGAPEDPEDIVQQVGRAGRNGMQAHAVLYKTKQPYPVDQSVKDLIKTGKESCLRKALYGKFEQNTQSLEPGHICCTFCHKSCSCLAEASVCAASGLCVEPVPSYEQTKKIIVPEKTRVVTRNHKKIIRDLLEKYKNDLVSAHPYLFTSQAACTGFSTQLIDAVLGNCANIFTLDYIDNHLPVFNPQHARHILQVMSDVFGDIENMPPVSPPEDSFCEPDIYYRGYFDKADDNADCVSDVDSSSSSDDDI